MNNDADKIERLSIIMGCRTDIDNMEISRIGRPRDGFNRAVKIIFSSTEERNEFTKNSKKLKECNGIWKKVYVKKDENPVYAAENFRLRKEFKALKENPENAGKSVVFKDGKIMIDEVVVDKNYFFC